MGYVGSRMRRLEDPRLLAGVGHFADDEERPGQLWMRVVRSPVAHAVLGAVDVGHALKLSGVRTVLTGADISVPPISSTYLNPSSLAMSIRCTSEVPSPISSTFASR
jgi:CO/xanthine dehydrogenase Mo-binding subunit